MFKFSFFSNHNPAVSFNSRLIRVNQLETALTGKKSTGECPKYFIFKSVFRIFFRGSMVCEITWHAGSSGSSFN